MSRSSLAAFPAARLAAACVATLAGGALTVQLGLTLGDALARGRPAIDAFINLFSYFTILSNTGVLLVAGAAALGRRSGLGAPSVQAALVVYILIVGLIYQTLLRGLIVQEGLRLVIDTVFHGLVPLAWPAWWLVWGRRAARLEWADAIRWLVFPLAYGGYTITRGLALGRWPYPFLDAGTLGWAQVALNLAGMLMMFWLFGAGVVALTRRAPKPLTMF